LSNGSLERPRPRRRGRRFRIRAAWAGALLALTVLLWIAALAATAAPVPFPQQTLTIKLDGIALGPALHPTSLNSLRYTATFNAGDGLYHLWVLNGGDSQTPADMQVSDITHATSFDGLNFTSLGKLAPPASWWTAVAGVGATVEPSVNFLRVDKLGGEWFLTARLDRDDGAARRERARARAPPAAAPRLATRYFTPHTPGAVRAPPTAWKMYESGAITRLASRPSRFAIRNREILRASSSGKVKRICPLS